MMPFTLLGDCNSPDLRNRSGVMNIQFWQIASGLGVGAFAAALFYAFTKQFGRKAGSGFETSKLSKEATFIIAVLLVLIFGAITIIALVRYAPDKSNPGLTSLLDRHETLKETLETFQPAPADKSKFDALKKNALAIVALYDNAAKRGDINEVANQAKALTQLLSTEEAKAILGDYFNTIQNLCDIDIQGLDDLHWLDPTGLNPGKEHTA